MNNKLLKAQQTELALSAKASGECLALAKKETENSELMEARLHAALEQLKQKESECASLKKHAAMVDSVLGKTGGVVKSPLPNLNLLKTRDVVGKVKGGGHGMPANRSVGTAPMPPVHSPNQVPQFVMHDPDSVVENTSLSYSYNHNYVGVNTQTGEMYEHLYTGRTTAGQIVSHVPSSVPDPQIQNGNANGYQSKSSTSIVVDDSSCASAPNTHRDTGGTKQTVIPMRINSPNEEDDDRDGALMLEGEKEVIS